MHIFPFMALSWEQRLDWHLSRFFLLANEECNNFSSVWRHSRCFLWLRSIVSRVQEIHSISEKRSQTTFCIIYDGKVSFTLEVANWIKSYGEILFSKLSRSFEEVQFEHWGRLAALIGRILILLLLHLPWHYQLLHVVFQLLLRISFWLGLVVK